MTSQTNQIMVMCLLSYTAASTRLQLFLLRCTQPNQGVHLMFRKKKSRVSFEKPPHFSDLVLFAAH